MSEQGAAVAQLSNTAGLASYANIQIYNMAETIAKYETNKGALGNKLYIFENYMKFIDQAAEDLKNPVIAAKFGGQSPMALLQLTDMKYGEWQKLEVQRMLQRGFEKFDEGEINQMSLYKKGDAAVS